MCSHDVVDGLFFGWPADCATGAFVGFVLLVGDDVVFAAVVEA